MPPDLPSAFSTVKSLKILLLPRGRSRVSWKRTGAAKKISNFPYPVGRLA